MAIKLFRKGTTHNVDGVDCEIRLFSARNGLSFIGVDGWCACIEDLEKKEIVEEVKLDSIKQPSKIRENAKDAGIDGWNKKRISTLKGELDGEGE